MDLISVGIAKQVEKELIAAKKTFVNEMQEEIAKYKWDNTHKANFLCIGDSMVEGAGTTDLNRCYVALVSKDIQTKQFGSSADEYMSYPSKSLIGVITAVSAANNLISIPGHNLTTGNQIVFSGTCPAGVTAGTTYYVIVGDENIIALSDGENTIDITDEVTGAMCTKIDTIIGAFTGAWSYVNDTYSTVTKTDDVRGWSKTMADGATMTIHSFGYKLKLLFASTGVFAEDAGSISYTIDGGAPTVVNLASSSKYKWVEIDPEGNYDVVITAVISGGKSVACQLIHLLGGFVGLRVHNIAIGGSQSTEWAARTNIIDAYAPKVSFLALGGNDMTQSITSVQYEANMRTIIDKLLTHGNVILGYYAPWVTEDTTLLAAIPVFRNVAKKLASEYDVPLVDMHNIYETGTEWDDAGLFEDTIHANDTGHYVIYEYFLSKIHI